MSSPEPRSETIGAADLQILKQLFFPVAGEVANTPGADSATAIQQMQAIFAELSRLAKTPGASTAIGVPTKSGGQSRELLPWNPALCYRALIERIPAVTFMAALDDTIHDLYISPQIETILGFTQREWLDNPFLWFNQLHPDDRARWETEFARTCSTGVNFRSEYRLIARDGRVVWVHGECEIVRDEHGRPLFLQGLAFDITESKCAEELLRRSRDEMEEAFRRRTAELAKSEGQLRAIFETAVDGMITIDERGQISSFNPAATRIFGYAQQEVVGTNVNSLMPAPYRQEHAGYLRNYLETGEKKIIGIGREVIGRRKDGTLFPMELGVSETFVGERRIFTGIVRDISERKKAEETLRASKEELRRSKEAAEAASKAKDQFLAVLSHELRTPLTPALTTVQFMERDPTLPPGTRESLAMVRRNIELESRLIDDLLDLTRITRGKIQLQHELVDAHESLVHAVQICQAEIDVKQLVISRSLGAREHHVWADRTRLQQMLWNMMSNAVKFTPEHGRITIESSNDARGRLVVAVRDSGVGIAPDVLPRLFHAFEQGEQTISRRFGGLGLGLMITRTLAELHHGSVTADSEGIGKGATFTLVLNSMPPRHRPTVAPMATMPTSEEPASKDSGSNKPQRPKLKILLVDDNADTLRVLAILIKGLGYDVQSATGVKSAIELADKHRFDVLVSDIGLPDGNGWEIMQYLRSKQAVRGIAISGYGMDEDLGKSREAGFDRHLVKPVNFDILDAVIRELAGLPVR